MNKETLNNKITAIPKSPGIYKYYDINGRIIYIGKATVLKNRVKSYFIGAPLDFTRGKHDLKTEIMIPEITDIKWQTTESVIEAIILESNLIKKYQPKYNILSKDDKSYIQIAITNEDFPRIIPIRPTDKITNDIKIKKLYGPYTDPLSIREILSIFRKIFTYRDCSEFKFKRHHKKNNPCLYYPIKLCPAPCVGLISKHEYRIVIKHMTDILEGKSKRVISSLKKEMKILSKNQKYEEAAKIRNQIFAYEHVNDIAVIKKERPLEQIKNIPARIEAYDISNIGKDFAVGSMIVFTHGEIDKSQYRKFRIKNLESRINNQNDTANIAEMIYRRFNHPEWKKPDLILIDGGKGQLSATIKVLHDHKLKIPIIAIAKGPSRKGFSLFKNSLAKKINLDKRFLESIRDEAHRFAIRYHRNIRDKIF